MNSSQRWSIFCAVAAAAVVLSGPVRAQPSSGDALESALRAQNFVLFKPMRSNTEAGSIIAFEADGSESLIAVPERCLPPSKVSPSKGASALLDGAFTVAKADKSAADISRTLTRGVDVTAAVGRGEVSLVRYKFIDPFISSIPKLDTRAYVRSLPAKSPCREEFVRQGNLVVHTVIGAKGVEYTFHTQDGKQLSLTTRFLELLGFSIQSSRDKAGTSSLRFEDKPILMGYRTWTASSVSSAAGDELELVDLSAEDTDKLRLMAASAKK